MKIPTGIAHPTHVDDETGEEWPQRNDPSHPTYSGAAAHCAKTVADAAPNAYPHHLYDRCVRAWEARP